MEVLIGLSVLIIMWLRWSRFYTNKQIQESLKEVKENKAYRSRVKFNEYLRYFKLDIRSGAKSMDVVYKTKNITIIKDENESVLMMNTKEADISSQREE